MPHEQTPLIRDADGNALERAAAHTGEATAKKSAYSNTQVIILCVARAVETGSFSMQVKLQSYNQHSTDEVKQDVTYRAGYGSQNRCL